ncbi:MAG: bifunctional UDP-sugar hydrolase/5'-nucleotidase [Bacteriovorax sp.]|nr:bifunctional UDP-sugar hydrolase/5'-nucleotidase [Bacteriovorax sp.]
MKLFYSTIIALVYFVSFSLNAKVIQILHTNDTHSFLAHSTHNLEQGGMARMKALIDQYKEEASQNNIKSIVLDAGDFLEGNIYYLAEEGKKTFQVHNETGYDVGALGNHDYLMGSDKFDELLGSIDLKFSFVAANIVINDKFKNLKRKIKPYAELNVDGIKIGVLGLTTNEPLYKWSLNNCEITDPVKTALFYEDELKKRGNDVIIALTHIGVLSDLNLAKHSSQIDLIVGGHSHDALFEPVYEKNTNGKSIPVVQAGMHTEYLGRILVDIEKGKPLKILKYELIPVVNKTTDVEIANLVSEAQTDLENDFGKEKLNEILGISLLNFNDKNGMVKWGVYIADTLRESTNSDISIHSPSMNSENFPSGVFTRLDLYNSIPRIFNLKDFGGWKVYTAEVKGIWLRSLIGIQAKLNNSIVFSGVERDESGKITINGKKINSLQSYKVAFMEGIIRGAGGIDIKLFNILRNPTETNIQIWSALERKIFNELKENELSGASKKAEKYLQVYSRQINDGATNN